MFKEEAHPRDENGKFTDKSASELKLELMQELPNKKMTPAEKIASVHIETGKDNYLPELNDETLIDIGLENNKQILVKASIIERNLRKHNDIDLEETNNILSQTLYLPNDVFLANNEKPYYCFVKSLRVSKKNGEEEYGTVIVDVDNQKENFEVVHWHYVKLKGLTKIKKSMDGLQPHHRT